MGVTSKCPYCGAKVEFDAKQCQACGREARLWNARLSLQRDVKLTEDATVESEDGTFECPFCGVTQTPGE